MFQDTDVVLNEPKSYLGFDIVKVWRVRKGTIELSYGNRDKL